MLERFDTVGKALEAAVDNCLQTCQAIHNLYVDGHPINTIPPNLATSLAEYIPRIQSLREKLQLTENIILHSMNASSSLVPIHTLPVEILARVFQLVQGDECIGHHQRRSQKLPVLMNICSYWRQVMINTPTFWSHIDLSTQRVNSIRSEIKYAQVYAERAAQTPLHVHIIESMGSSTDETHEACISLIPFIVSIASRVQSFRFEPRSPRAYRRILRQFIKNCTPGIFTTLHTHSSSSQLFWLDTEVSLDPDAKTLLMDISRERLEEVYLGMKILRLRHIYPHWSSSAYKGLVELRLGGISYRITESQLVEVIRQSPGLRILECTTRLASPLIRDEQVQPITLIDLEVLNLRYNPVSVVDNIVRWLAPGPKPLKFIIAGLGSISPSLAAFFARSNVTRVYSGGYDMLNKPHMIPCFPSLRCIALGGWSLNLKINHGRDKYHISNAAQSAVETIYIIYFELYLNGFDILQDVVSLESVRRVIFYGCNIQNTQEFLSVLSTLNPKASFRIIPSHEPNPVDDWEIFAPRSLS